MSTSLSAGRESVGEIEISNRVVRSLLLFSLFPPAMRLLVGVYRAKAQVAGLLLL